LLPSKESKDGKKGQRKDSFERNWKKEIGDEKQKKNTLPVNFKWGEGGGQSGGKKKTLSLHHARVKREKKKVKKGDGEERRAVRHTRPGNPKRRGYLEHGRTNPSVKS